MCIIVFKNLDLSIINLYISIRIIFEGEFKDMNNRKISIHEVLLPIPVQPVQVSLYLVHSDNYKLSTKLDNYTAIMINGTKGQQKLQLKREVGVNIGKWTHVKKAVFSYKRNSIGWWRFRFQPKLDKIPIQELSSLSIRYGGVLVIKAQKLPKGNTSLREAIEAAKNESDMATKSMNRNRTLWERYD